VGAALPAIGLRSTSGLLVDLSALPGRTIVYAFPRTGRPDEDDSDEWDAIPGARGCTPESCAFRDRFDELTMAGVRLFGLSTQTSSYQQETVERLRLPFPLLSDSSLALTRALALPTFDFEPYGAESRVHLKRFTLVVDDGHIAKVFYPIFPPHEHARDVARWLNTRNE
jgi:peroxiredoxin